MGKCPIILQIFTRYHTSQVVQDLFHQQYLLKHDDWKLLYLLSLKQNSPFSVAFAVKLEGETKRPSSNCHQLQKPIGSMHDIWSNFIATSSLFLINIDPLLSPPPTPEKSLCLPHKMLEFICHTWPTPRIWFTEKNCVVPTPQESLCFLR